MFVFMSIDTVQHYFWQHMDKDHFIHDPKLAPKFGDAVRKVYERLDAAAGQIIDRLPHGYRRYLSVSDHGGGPVVDRTVYLNRYLAQLGPLHYNEKRPRQAFGPFGMKVLRCRVLVPAAAHSLRARRAASPCSFQSSGRRAKWRIRRSPSIDWSRTKAYCSEVLASPPSIWINLKGDKASGHRRSGRTTTASLDFIIAKLAELKDPRTGKPVINRVYRRDEIFHGPFSPMRALTSCSIGGAKTASSPRSPASRKIPTSRPLSFGNTSHLETSEWGGTHRLDGILDRPRTGLEDRSRNRKCASDRSCSHHSPSPRSSRPRRHGWQCAWPMPSGPSSSRSILCKAGAASGTSGGSPERLHRRRRSAKVEERLQALGYIE